MKKSGWIALVLFVGSIMCSIWLIMSGAALSALASYQEQPDKIPGILINNAICMFVPAEMAVVSAAILWFTKRFAYEAELYDKDAMSHHTHHKELINTLTEVLMLCPQVKLDTALRAFIQAEVREALPGMSVVEQGRTLLVLYRIGLLSGAEPLSLYGIDLAGIDLRFADLRGAELAGLNLCEACLVGADLRGCNLRGTNLSKADLRLAQLDSASLDQSNLQYALLQRASLRSARFRGALLKHANLWEADVQDALMPNQMPQNITSAIVE